MDGVGRWTELKALWTQEDLAEPQLLYNAAAWKPVLTTQGSGSTPPLPCTSGAVTYTNSEPLDTRTRENVGFIFNT